MSKKYKVELNSIVKQSEELVASDMDGEVVMMSIEQGKYYGLDDIASAIWPLIEAPCTVALLCDKLREQFYVSATQCQEDVLAFLNDMAEKEIIEITDAPAP